MLGLVSFQAGHRVLKEDPIYPTCGSLFRSSLQRSVEERIFRPLRGP